MNRAFFYTSENDTVHCHLCSHGCVIGDGRRGICSVRENRGGVLYSLNYGKLVARNIDPIEKKPLFHVLPGSLTYSISTLGCNFSCRHCQNHSISQLERTAPVTGVDCSPDEVVAATEAGGCESISYTYVEPTIFYEYAYDCARLAKERGLKNFFVSNGYMAEEPTRKLAPFIDGINVDIKGFSEDFYTHVAGAKLAPVLNHIELLVALGVWVEVTTLLIGGLNDSDQELKDLAAFIASVDVNIPWHITAFHPAYRMTNVGPTSRESLIRAMKIGREAGLNHVYMGNVAGGEEDTRCSNCNTVLVERKRFTIRAIYVKNGACPSCGKSVPGVWT